MDNPTENFFSLFDNVSEAIMVLDYDVFIDCNKSTEKLFNLKRENIINAHPYDLSPKNQPDGELSKSKALKHIDKAYNEMTNRFEWLHTRGQEKDFIADVSMNLIQFDGKDYLLVVLRDITDQKQKEKSLRDYHSQLESVVNERTRELLASDEKFRQVFESSPNYILICELESGNIVDANPQFLDALDYDLSEIKGKNPSEQGIVEHDTFLKVRDQLFSIGRYSQINATLTSKKGDHLYCICSGEVIKVNNIEFALHVINDDTERQSIIKKLKQSEKNYRQIFNTISDAIFIRDIERNVLVDVNEAFFNMTGYTREDAHMVVPAEEREEYSNLIDNVIKDGIRQFEWKAKTKDNRILDLEVIIKLIEIDERKCVLGVLRDISQRRKSEELIRENELKYRMLYENANDALFLMSGDKFVDCNTKTLEMFECTREEIIGFPPYEFSPKYQPDGQKSKEKAIGFIQKALKDELQPFEWIHKTKKGKEFFAEVSLNNFYLNKDLYLLAIVRDISLRKQVENIVKASEENFRNIYSYSIDAIVISDLKGKIIDANPAFLKILGLSRNDISSLNLMRIVHPEYLRSFVKKLKGLDETTEIPYIEIELIKKNGKSIIAELRSKLIQFNNHQVIMTFGRDITERKELEKKLFDTIIETEEKERARIAGDLHDEIGPLLSSLKMYISSLSNTQDDQKTDYITEQLQKLVKEAITNVREISNALSPHILTNYGLHAALRVIVDQNKDFIHLNFDSNLEELRFNTNVEIVYYRIIKELLNNTIKHSGAENVSIKISYNGEALRLEYRDDGKGFDINKVLQSQKKGIGLFNILNRIKTINGRYRVGGAKDKGFEFSLYTKVKNIDNIK